MNKFKIKILLLFIIIAFTKCNESCIINKSKKKFQIIFIDILRLEYDLLIRSLLWSYSNKCKYKFGILGQCEKSNHMKSKMNLLDSLPCKLYKTNNITNNIDNNTIINLSLNSQTIEGTVNYPSIKTVSTYDIIVGHINIGLMKFSKKNKIPITWMMDPFDMLINYAIQELKLYMQGRRANIDKIKDIKSNINSQVNFCIEKMLYRIQNKLFRYGKDKFYSVYANYFLSDQSRSPSISTHNLLLEIKKNMKSFSFIGINDNVLLSLDILQFKLDKTLSLGTRFWNTTSWNLNTNASTSDTSTSSLFSSTWTNLFKKSNNIIKLNGYNRINDKILKEEIIKVLQENDNGIMIQKNLQYEYDLYIAGINIHISQCYNMLNVLEYVEKNCTKFLYEDNFINHSNKEIQYLRKFYLDHDREKDLQKKQREIVDNVYWGNYTFTDWNFNA
jgi:hypothetical protein